MRQYILIILLLAGAFSVSAQQGYELTPSKCREMALSSSEDIKKAENSLRQAELTKKIATTAFLPAIEGSATGAIVFPNQDMLGMELVLKGVYMAGITLSQPLFVGGKIFAGHSLAKIGEAAAQDQLRMKRSEVIAEADQTYWSYVAVREKIKMLDSYMAQMDTLYMQTEAAQRVGLATRTELLRVEAHRSNLRYQHQKASNGLELCRMALCRVVGLDMNTEVSVPDTEIPVETPGELSSDFSSRPEMLLLNRQVEAGKYQERMARADMLPMLALSVGGLYYGGIKIKGTTTLPDGSIYPYTTKMGQGIGMAMLALKVPIFHWGEATKKLKKVKLDTASARLDLEKNTKLMTLEVRQAMMNLEEGYLLIGSARKAVEETEESLRVTREKYLQSMTTLSDLLNAQSEWQQAVSNLIEAQTQYMIYRTSYLKATGRLE